MTDVNNEDHTLWVDKLAHRKGVYILINENDSALLASSSKTGPDQKVRFERLHNWINIVRLGHYTHNLSSKVAVYLDVTDAKNVGRSHAYFEGT